MILVYLPYVFIEGLYLHLRFNDPDWKYIGCAALANLAVLPFGAYMMMWALRYSGSVEIWLIIAIQMLVVVGKAFAYRALVGWRFFHGFLLALGAHVLLIALILGMRYVL